MLRPGALIPKGNFSFGASPSQFVIHRLLFRSVEDHWPPSVSWFISRPPMPLMDFFYFFTLLLVPIFQSTFEFYSRLEWKRSLLGPASIGNEDRIGPLIYFYFFHFALFQVVLFNTSKSDGRSIRYRTFLRLRQASSCQLRTVVTLLYSKKTLKMKDSSSAENTPLSSSLSTIFRDGGGSIQSTRVSLEYTRNKFFELTFLVTKPKSEHTQRRHKLHCTHTNAVHSTF